MTDAQRKMKRYTSAIRRRLNLPREVKARVMNDFITTISAMQEAGKTDGEIYAELGAPKKVAADLNEQMNEFAYRKSPWRFAFLTLAVVAGAKLAGDVLPAALGYLFLRAAAVFTPAESAGIGIIGGADGPTAIFVTTAPWTGAVIALAALLIGVLGFLRLRKCLPSKKPKAE